MVAILEIPEVRARISPVSVADYHRMPEFNSRGKRTELLRGIVIEKMSKSPLHSSIGTRLVMRFIEMTPPGFLVRKEDPLTLADSEPEPDLSLIACPRGEDFSRAHPTTAEVVVEVAISSAALDRANTGLYAEAGVKEYWIVLGASQIVEVYREPENGVYRTMQTYRTGETIVSAAVPELQLPVDRIFRDDA